MGSATNVYGPSGSSGSSGINGTSGISVTGLTNYFQRNGSDISTITLNDAIIASDHGTASAAQVVNFCYGTGDPPTASSTTIGTIYIKYIP